ncbi:hypothetical protein ETH_00024105 [Eimeria tenella]|uniref:Uncharacterized protein n=1 Tax=Eimeria tenella TaxID=5802 RepID=U6KXY1_EIMTE|nr:hypothetical protein ETH_00024105 [Eimeria tenella]CDJ41189.1 hypothetical protein ETH_00024105 [Eimeria tenella]|eukprot:XP_013231939.1 hypothetical protein ETH_00024105 [Eimeria tenella]
MVSGLRAEEIPADSPEAWLRRLTVKTEPAEDATTGGSSSAAAATAAAAARRCSKREGGKQLKEKKEKKEGPRKPPKAERILMPREDPVYRPALAPSQLPLGFSQVANRGEESFSEQQQQLLALGAPGEKGLWRMHARSGLKYRKGPFTQEEQQLLREALQQFAQQEGLGSAEEAARSLASSGGPPGGPPGGRKLGKSCRPSASPGAAFRRRASRSKRMRS